MLDKAWNLVLRKVMLNHFYLFSYGHRKKKKLRGLFSPNTIYHIPRAFTANN